MNIRYIFKDKINQVVYEKIHSLEEIEKNGVGGPFTEILSRDIGTGKVDRTGKKEIFGKDLLLWPRTGAKFRVDWECSNWKMTRVEGPYSYRIFDNVAPECEIIGRAEE